ncbi:hypothetical protein [Pedobacter sp. BMA]|uniref:hypothetical protein n=1 Tax=Pedobacter sp. BMA TaxID=1663685 RepID=UPI000A994634|nr:hypothetical protein [Pedobacter sp. BMA]
MKNIAILSLLLFSVTVSSNSFSQTYPACYVGNTSGGARVYIIKHPTRTGNTFTSTPANNNYAVFGTGNFNCTNFPNGVFARSVVNSSTPCDVYGTNSSGNEIYIGGGVLVNNYIIYRCPIDKTLFIMLFPISFLGFFVIRKKMKFKALS